MTEWWKKPYAGGPMAVPAKYFPRPLYPPDAKGKTPSKPGPDVEAYKRTISRLGRWKPWEPTSWDRDFNNAFSHGRGTGDVGDSGVEGFQRQMKIDPTGNIGQKTFNTLASCRIPDDPAFVHAGEMAMDPNSCNLIVEAFEIYGGKAALPPPPPDAKPQRERVLDAARGWLGYIESGNNDTIFGDWYGMNHQPWCAIFITYLYEVEAGGNDAFARGAAYSYVPYVVNNAKAGKGGLEVTTSPLPGDLCCFDWQSDGLPDHIGVFESGTASSFNAIEGNTSPSDNSNGGQVMRRSRSSSQARITFVRVSEP